MFFASQAIVPDILHQLEHGLEKEDDLETRCSMMEGLASITKVQVTLFC
jgi:hypothetical protein